MTVDDLINRLRKLDGDMPICIKARDFLKDGLIEVDDFVIGEAYHVGTSPYCGEYTLAADWNESLEEHYLKRKVVIL